MFEINYMSSEKRVLNRIEGENLGTQSRIYDCNTGIFTRILTNDHKTYSFAEAGIGWNGILQDNYEFYNVLECDEDEAFELMLSITSKIEEQRGLTADDVNFVIQNGFLELLSQRDIELSNQPEFQTLLRADRILRQFENSGKIGYNEVLEEINNQLENGSLSDEDRKIMEQLKAVYGNEMFKQQREGDKTIQDEQRKREEQHTSQDISEDLQEIGRSGIEENALAGVIDGQETKDNDREGK